MSFIFLKFNFFGEYNVYASFLLSQYNKNFKLVQIFSLLYKLKNKKIFKTLVSL